MQYSQHQIGRPPRIKDRRPDKKTKTSRGIRAMIKGWLSRKNDAPGFSNVRSREQQDEHIHKLLALFREGYSQSKGGDDAFYSNRNKIKTYITQLENSGCEWKLIESCINKLLKSGEHFGRDHTLLNPSTVNALITRSKQLFDVQDIDGSAMIKKFIDFMKDIIQLGKASHYTDAQDLLYAYMTVANEPNKFKSIKEIIHLLAPKRREIDPRHIKYVAKLIQLDQEVLELIISQQKELKHKKYLHFWVDVYAPILKRPSKGSQETDKLLYENPLLAVKTIGKKIKYFIEIADMLSKKSTYLIKDKDVKHILKLKPDTLNALRLSTYRLSVARCLDQWELAHYALVKEDSKEPLQKHKKDPQELKEYLKSPKDVQDLLDTLWIAGGLFPKASLGQEGILDVCYKLDYFKEDTFLISPLLRSFIERLHTQSSMAQHASKEKYQGLSSEKLEEEKNILKTMHAIVHQLTLNEQEQLRVGQKLLMHSAVNFKRLKALETLFKSLNNKKAAKDFLEFLMNLQKTSSTLGGESLLEASLEILVMLHQKRILIKNREIFSSKWKTLFALDGGPQNPWRVKDMLVALDKKGLLTEKNTCGVIDFLNNCKDRPEPYRKKATQNTPPPYAGVPRSRLSVLIQNVERLSEGSRSQPKIFEKLVNNVSAISLEVEQNASFVFDEHKRSKLEKKAITAYLSEQFSVLREKNTATYKETQKNLEIIWEAGLSNSWIQLLLFWKSYLIDPNAINSLLNNLHRKELLKDYGAHLTEMLHILPYTQAGNNKEVLTSPILKDFVQKIITICDTHSREGWQSLPWRTQRISEQFKKAKEIAEISYQEGLTVAQQEKLLGLKDREKFIKLWQLLKENVAPSEGYCAWVLEQCHGNLATGCDFYRLIEIFEERKVLNKENFRAFRRALDEYAVDDYFEGSSDFQRERERFVACLSMFGKVLQGSDSPQYCFRRFFEFISNDIKDGRGERLEGLLTVFTKISRQGAASGYLVKFLELVSTLQYQRYTSPLSNTLETGHLSTISETRPLSRTSEVENENLPSSNNVDKEYKVYFEKLLQLGVEELGTIYHQINMGHRLKDILKGEVGPVHPLLCATEGKRSEQAPINRSIGHRNVSQDNRGNELLSSRYYGSHGRTTNAPTLPSTCYQAPLPIPRTRYNPSEAKPPSYRTR